MKTKKDEIYNFIVNYAIKEGVLPTIREIMFGVGLTSTASVYSHFKKLVLEGKIEPIDGTKRYKVKGLRYEIRKKRK